MIGVLGAGAFGTALALTLCRAGGDVVLWGREPGLVDRRESRRLPGVALPAQLRLTDDLAQVQADTLLLAVPMQALAAFLDAHRRLLDGRTLVACCKGLDLRSGLGPAALIARGCPGSVAALISGPGFAADLALGLPTAMTLAAPEERGEDLQRLLSGDTLRLYRSADLTGVEIGGAVKNVIAIACGIAIGAGLGESARAALMTRGYAEMVRFAVARGADPRTLAGLSGLGDLVLTATSAKSRNYSHGLAIGAGHPTTEGVTVEGVATCRALAALGGGDLPVTETLARVLDGALSVAEAMRHLLARPLKAE
jgi:glycerol-3-phosphate dehydrogenase (NAD(P)+)